MSRGCEQQKELLQVGLVEHERLPCTAANGTPVRITCSRYGPLALPARLRGPKTHTNDGSSGSEDAAKAYTAWLTHPRRPSWISAATK